MNLFWSAQVWLDIPEVPFKTSGGLAESSRMTQQPFPQQAAYSPIRFGMKTTWVRFQLPGSVCGKCPDSCYSYLLVVSNSGRLISTYYRVRCWNDTIQMKCSNSAWWEAVSGYVAPYSFGAIYLNSYSKPKSMKVIASNLYSKNVIRRH